MDFSVCSSAPCFWPSVMCCCWNGCSSTRSIASITMISQHGEVDQWQAGLRRLDLNLVRDYKRILDVNVAISHGSPNLAVAERELDHSDVVCSSADHRNNRHPQADVLREVTSL